MRFNSLFATMALGVVALAACGGGTQSADATHASALPVVMANSAVVAKSGDTSLGSVLASPSGRTLYALTRDTKSNSSCTGACARVWPPVPADKGWTVASGLDRSLFSTILRQDGTRQLVAGESPLYTFSGDTEPGDVNGEGSGGVWFAVGTTGQLVKPAPAGATPKVASGGY